MGLTKKEIYGFIIFAVALLFWCFIFAPWFQTWIYVQGFFMQSPLFSYQLFNLVCLMAFVFSVYCLLRALGKVEKYRGKQQMGEVGMSAHFRHVFEAIIGAILFLTQRVPFSGGFFTMLIPITTLILYLPAYIPNLITNPEILTYEVFYWRLSTISGILGLIIAVAGFAIFVKALIHFLKGRRDLVTTGLYSVVRHPQYLGIMLTVLGGSMLCMAAAVDLLLAVIGYILLAGYEERNLLKEHEKEYREYRQKTPFFFPVRCPTAVNEFLFSLFIALLLVAVAFLSRSLTTNGTEWYIGS